MKNKTVTFLVAIVASGVFAGVAFGGSNVRTFYNNNLKEAVDNGAEKAMDAAKDAGGAIAGNAKDFSSSLYDKASEKAGEGFHDLIAVPAENAWRNIVKGVVSAGASALTEEEKKEILNDDSCTCP
ncbi:MAG: hypothetical protein PHH21_00810 [Candidatus Pacebacteria bacterium]|nr:hypothetical protein [Candidatus Paceibacterota bacterium]